MERRGVRTIPAAIPCREAASRSADPARVGSRRDTGFSLVELLVVVALIGVLGTVVVPGLLRLTRALRLEMGAREIVSVLRTARGQAIRRGTRVGVRFETVEGARISFAMYSDGDGDGIRSADIRSGVDPQIMRQRVLEHVGAAVQMGFPPGMVPRDPGDPSRRLDRLHDPVRFGRSDIASFNPVGGSSPGSVYLTDRRQGLVAVRVLGQTGRIRILTYDGQIEIWH